MTIFIRKILFPILIFTSIFLLVLRFFSTSSTTNSNYVLKSYKNTVALYNGEEIVEVYNEIVLNTLPTKDIQNFNKGIPFFTHQQAQIYLQDFE